MAPEEKDQKLADITSKLEKLIDGSDNARMRSVALNYIARTWIRVPVNFIKYYLRPNALLLEHL